MFTYCRAFHHTRSKEWMEKDRFPQVFHCVHFPPQSRRLGVGANPSANWLFLHRRPPLLRYRVHALAQILAHLAEVDPSKNLALQLRQLYPLLGCNFRPLRHEALVAEANSSSQPPRSPHQGWSPSRSVCFSPCQSVFCFLLHFGE